MGGTASARSLLVLLLGEYVLPAGGTLRTRQTVEGLAALGVAEPAARQALRRLSADGWLVSTGARGEWSVGDPALRLLAEGKRRFGRASHPTPDWDGAWLLVRTTVPEARRELRHQLRSALAFQGLGSLGQGWWVSADVSVEPVVAEVLDRLGVEATSFRAAAGDIGLGPTELVAEAWDLGDARARYEKLLGEYRSAAPDDDAADVFAVYTSLVDGWRRALAVDPQLPRQLLPSDWPGHDARDLVNDRYSRWHDRAADWWAGR